MQSLQISVKVNVRVDITLRYMWFILEDRHMVLGSSYGANGTAFSHGEVRVAAPHFYLKAGLICLITPSHDIAQDC